MSRLICVVIMLVKFVEKKYNKARMRTDVAIMCDNNNDYIKNEYVLSKVDICKRTIVLTNNQLVLILLKFKVACQLSSPVKMLNLLGTIVSTVWAVFHSRKLFYFFRDGY